MKNSHVCNYWTFFTSSKGPFFHVFHFKVVILKAPPFEFFGTVRLKILIFHLKLFSQYI